MEFAFTEPGRFGLTRFEVRAGAEEVWFDVPVRTEYGGTLQRKSLRPVDAAALGQALVAEALGLLAVEPS